MSGKGATDSVLTSPLAGEVGASCAPGGGSPTDGPCDCAPPSLTLPRKGGGDVPSPRRWLRTSLIASLLVIACAVAAGACWIASLGPAPIGEGLAFSTLVVDRDGKLLRPYTTPEGRWRLPATRENVDPRFLTLLLAYEDKRFDSHQGVDPLALGRAVSQLLRNGRIVSGASTITMQVARLLEPRVERSLTAKLRQMVRAVEIERALSKDEILALYLSLAPYGGNLEGVRAASLAYFGKEPRRLTLGEAAMLVALPQSPEQRRPDRSIDAARNARDRVLDRVALAGVVPLDEIARAKQEPVPDGRKPMPMLAPHAADAVVAAAPQRSLHRLTIEATLQRNLEELARERARALGPDISIAILAVDHATGEVLARVASADYFDSRRAGQVDMTSAVRSPGSTLKPFIYGLGFEDGLIHPDTLVEDRPVRFGGYAPENFDLTFQGTVTVRRALQLSLNVPAVAVLDKIGSSRFAARLEQAGGSLVLPPGEAPGLAMGLGGVGVKLSDLVTLFAGLARQGTTVPLIERIADGEEARLMSRERVRTQNRVPLLLNALYRAGCSTRPPPGMWATSCSARLRRRMLPAAASPSRPAHPTDTAMPGRSASTASAPSASGSAAPTARRCPGWWRALPRRRSCSTPLPAPASCRRRCRRRRRARWSRPRASCRRRCSVSARVRWRARAPSRSFASCFRPMARGSSSRATRPASPIRSP